MISMSRTGSTDPETCTMSSFSKQRVTCRRASTSRMLARNLLPSPSPLLAPSTRPAMSTRRRAAGMIFFVSMWVLIRSSRGSGTLTTPTLGSIVQNG